ncbi:hypothetical protein HFP89_03140 [Wenzhouxiangella sp. XN79A]|uniref:hypothetical protein n=1 Tax=Wenzhouxiangella sp. XN79A TaxID=2724193 RepID=UPI00144A6C3B|nr:hypothetical protein [Wenzhouxiangella sp. XN79A]NKI34160.1 hypothetical protein [Wenzhouxiangella sp. XN79A]
MPAFASQRRTPRRAGVALTGLIALSLSGCAEQQADPPPAEAPAAVDSDRQTAFRVRADATAGLNKDGGWAAGLDQVAEVTVDRPFRLRFEVAAGDDAGTRRYRLESRRNGGPWQAVTAEDFPYPYKFEELTADPARESLRIERGSAEAISITTDEAAAYWRIDAGPEGVLAWAQYDIHWTPTEIAAEFRLPDAEMAGAAVVFDRDVEGGSTRVELLTPDRLRVVRRQAGEDIVLTERAAVLDPGSWQELKLLIDGRDLVVELDDAEVLQHALERPTRPRLGVYVPAGRAAELGPLTLETDAASPRTSILRADGFRHGDSTNDLLPGSGQPFTGGAGISFAERTPAWDADGGHGEWSFPLVIRRFADEAALNEHGDRFDYRLVDEQGEPVPAEVTASVRVRVPDGHLGGTFVETPMRLGPWQAGNGELYFVLEPSETWNRMMVVKSSDHGRSWREVDGPNRPQTGDLEGFASVRVGSRIHMLHQTSEAVLYHAFDTADHPEQPDRWAVRDERVDAPPEPPTQVADLAVRPDGRILAVYGAGEELRVAVRRPDGAWSEPHTIAEPSGATLSGPSLLLGANGIAHLAYTASDGSARYRRIGADDAIGKPVRFAADLATGEQDVGAILPLVALPEPEALSLIWRSADGRLRERRVDAGGRWSDPVNVSDRIVVQSAVDSDQVGADAVADGDTVHLLFIEDGTGRLFHSARSSGDWTEPRVVVTDADVQWVRGSIIEAADGERVYGFVYDAGSNGGSGRNRFATLSLR